jgi:hypothetical protein
VRRAGKKVKGRKFGALVDTEGRRMRLASAQVVMVEVCEARKAVLCHASGGGAR